MFSKRKIKIIIRQYAYLLFLTITILSCNHSENKTPNTSRDAELTVKEVPDSLDTDKTENYITSGFPKNIYDTVYPASLKIQWQLIKSTFDFNSTFDLNYFEEQAAKNKFILDTTDLEELVFIKREFNKRQAIILSALKNKKFKCQIQCIYRFEKHKYLAVIDYEFPKQLPKGFVWDFGH